MSKKHSPVDLYQISDLKNVKKYTPKMNSMIIEWYNELLYSHDFIKFIDLSVFDYMDHIELDEIIEEIRLTVLTCSIELLNIKIDQLNGLINTDILQMIAAVCFIVATKAIPIPILQYDWTMPKASFYTILSKSIYGSSTKENMTLMKQMEIDILKNVDWQPCKLYNFVKIPKQ